MSGKQLAMKFSASMDEDAGLIQAHLIASGEPKTFRANAVYEAVDHFVKSIPLPRETVIALREAYSNDKFNVAAEDRMKRGIWLLQSVKEQIDQIGEYLDGLYSKKLPEAERIFIPKVKASKSGYNQALVIFFALRLLADELRVKYPDLVPVPPEAESDEDSNAGRPKETTDDMLEKYPEIVKYLRQGMRPGDVIKQADVKASLNTVKKVKTILDDEE